MKKIVILLLILSFGCSSKKERVETVIMSCVNNLEDEDGVKIVKYIELYEKYLIQENILKSKSAESYRELLLNFSKEKNIEIKLDETDSLCLKVFQNRSKINNDLMFQNIFKCHNDIKPDSLKYNWKKFRLIKNTSKLLAEKHKNVSNTDMVKIFSTILAEEDFKLDFYKAMLLYSLIEYNAPPL